MKLYSHSRNKKSPGTVDAGAYRRLAETLRKRPGGVTVADMTAASALPLAVVQELLPRAADEYSARLEVSESGEIVYSFPRGFVSRYRGFKAGLKRFLGTSGRLLARLGSLAFKVWIMFMLIGYFVLFMAIALGSLFVSASVNSRNSGNRRSGGSFNAGFFSLLWRIWFYSELTRPAYRDYGGIRGKASPAGRPMHRAIFSFVFGEEDPNRDWENREKKRSSPVSSQGAALSRCRNLWALPDRTARTRAGRFWLSAPNSAAIPKPLRMEPWCTALTNSFCAPTGRTVPSAACPRPSGGLKNFPAIQKP
ncbi:MAG: hypothetical protein LBP27_05030 [Treponema sp.]|jgi:hypothetical protein|nr:hypothetical protein [Treponema sp.]